MTWYKIDPDETKESCPFGQSLNDKMRESIDAVAPSLPILNAGGNYIRFGNNYDLNASRSVLAYSAYLLFQHHLVWIPDGVRRVRCNLYYNTPNSDPGQQIKVRLYNYDIGEEFWSDGLNNAPAVTFTWGEVDVEQMTSGSFFSAEVWAVNDYIGAANYDLRHILMRPLLD